jgi:drug/metabolite transporter (DMT)-like permease
MKRAFRTTVALLALAGAAFGAFATIEVRRLSQSEKTGAIVFYFSATCALLSLLTVAFGWRMPDARQAGLLVLSGILGGVGQILLTASYRYAPVSVVAPFDYTSLLWALVLGFAIFGDIPAPLVMVGAAMVVAAGLFVLWREHRLGLRARQEREAAPQRTT